jgi:hypothetical protein
MGGLNVRIPIILGPAAIANTTIGCKCNLCRILVFLPNPMTDGPQFTATVVEIEKGRHRNTEVIVSQSSGSSLKALDSVILQRG